MDRIELLRDYLPAFLSENKNLYSILSVGIHSLQENECLAYFETVKIGIELILDEKVEQQQKIAKIEEAKRKLAILSSKISKNYSIENNTKVFKKKAVKSNIRIMTTLASKNVSLLLSVCYVTIRISQAVSNPP